MVVAIRTYDIELWGSVIPSTEQNYIVLQHLTEQNYNTIIQDSSTGTLLATIEPIIYIINRCAFAAAGHITRAGATGAEDRRPATTRTAATVSPRPKCPRSSPRSRASRASPSRPCRRPIRFAQTPRACAA